MKNTSRSASNVLSFRHYTTTRSILRKSFSFLRFSLRARHIPFYRLLCTIIVQCARVYRVLCTERCNLQIYRFSNRREPYRVLVSSNNILLTSKRRISHTTSATQIHVRASQVCVYRHDVVIKCLRLGDTQLSVDSYTPNTFANSLSIKKHTQIRA